MNYNKKMLLIGVAVSVCASCGWLKKENNEGNAVDSTKNTAREWKLMGQWESECKGSDLFHAHEKESYKFEGDLFTYEKKFYIGSEQCDDTPSVSYSYDGTFKLGSTVEAAENARDVNFDYRHSFINPHTDGGIKALEAVHFCGIKEWKIDEKQEIANKNKGADCPLHRVPQKHYDLVKIEDNKLFFGHTGSFELSESRPVELDRETVYNKK